jgi:hypothetical protein
LVTNPSSTNLFSAGRFRRVKGYSALAGFCAGHFVRFHRSIRLYIQSAV